MDNLSLLERFSDPEMLNAMGFGEKLIASLYVSVLGMLVTFVALVIIWGLIIVMGKMFNTTHPKKEEKKEIEIVKVVEKVGEEEGKEEELIAVITAAIAGSLNTSTHNIKVRNIVRIPDRTPAWSRAGRVEQMNRML